jgi:hypothetical protein
VCWIGSSGCRYADNAPAIPKCGGGGRDPETAALAIDILLQLCFHYVDADGLRAAYAGELGIDGLLQACLVRVARNELTPATRMSAQWRGYLCFLCICLFFRSLFFSFTLSLSPSSSFCLSSSIFFFLPFHSVPSSLFVFSSVRLHSHLTPVSESQSRAVGAQHGCAGANQLVTSRIETTGSGSHHPTLAAWCQHAVVVATETHHD